MMNEMNNKKILTIDKNCVFKSKIENIFDFNKSLFKDSYSQAERCLLEIVNFAYGENDNSNDFNNIIAFVGDRGSGKTSTMKSFRQSLDGDSNKLREVAEQNKKRNNNIKFELLDIIDPMLFSNKESIIEIVVAQMFKKFRDKKSDDNLMKKKELARKFERVYKDIKIINTSKENILEQSYDNLEALIDLSSATSLRDDLNELIKQYINYMNNLDSTSDWFIVISIDDIDMNLTVGEKMLEDIRKYLVLPNVVILMAVKFEQLEEVVGQKFANDLKGNLELATCINKQSEFKEGIDDKTEKYLEKLIPFSRRVYMPKLSISGINLQITGFDNISTKDKNSKDLNSISSIINYNLNRKMGYVTITENHYKVIIPQNLRLFIDFIVMLNNMKSSEESESYRTENIEIFKTYIRDVLIPNIKDTEKRKQLTYILDCNFKKLNGKSLFYLNRCINNYNNEISDIDPIIKERVDWINKNKLIINEDRIEYGDIITWIKMVQRNKVNILQDNSVEIFKCIYSLRLLEKFYKDPIALFKETGFNFVGDYYRVTDNKRISCISREVNIKNMAKFKEYEFRFAIFDILFDKNENMNRHNRLLRREKKEYLIDDEFNIFTNFELNSFNMVGYCMYKNLFEKYTDKYKEYFNDGSKGQIKYLKNELDDTMEINKNESLDCQYSLVVNIDFWMEILKALDSVVQLYSGSDPIGSMSNNFEYINEAHKQICSLYNIECTNEGEGKKNSDIINDEEIKQFKKFIKEHKMYLSNDQANLENYKNVKKYIEKLLVYFQSKEEGTGLSKFKNTVNNILKNMDIKGFKNDSNYQKYINKITAEIINTNPKNKLNESETESNIKIISYCIATTEELKKYIDHKIEELNDMKNIVNSSNEDNNIKTESEKNTNNAGEKPGDKKDEGTNKGKSSNSSSDEEGNLSTDGNEQETVNQTYHQN